MLLASAVMNLASTSAARPAPPPCFRSVKVEDVLQHLRGRFIGRGDPDLAYDRKPGRDHRADRPQRGDADGGIAKKRLAGEIDVARHREFSLLPGEALHTKYSAWALCAEISPA